MSLSQYGPIAGLVGQAYDALASMSTTRLVLTLLINIPLLSIAFNVIYQLLPKDKSLPPVVWHWFPWFGSAAAYGEDPIKFFFDCKEKYGNVFTFVLLGRRVTAALTPAGNNFILGGKHTVFSAEDAYTHLTTPVFGKDVVYDCPNELLMEQKKFVKFGLSTDNLRQYVGMIEQEVLQFMKDDASFKIFQMNDINEWGSFDVLKAISELTILTASRTLQGKEVRANITKEYAEVYSDLDGGFTPLHFMFPNLPLESYRKRDAAHKKISDFYVSIIEKRRANPGQEEEHDMIAALMNQKYRVGRPLQDHEIAHIMIALLMAGQHTSSASGSWSLLHIADRPDIADALYEEQVKHFRQSDGTWRTPEFEELRDLPVLDSVIRETLRIHPPIHSIMRAVREDVVVPPTLAAPSEDGRYVIPKGHVVVSSAAISQVDPMLWKNANAWDPTRWSDPEGVAAQAYKQYDDAEGAKVDFGFGLVSKGTESPYQPFGAGRHRCIGEQFAYLQLGTIISTFVRQIEMRLPETGMPAPNYHTMITLPKAPRNILYRRRNFD
ncbi:cytochrome P450 [Phanerochaete sordida]|uniref:Cytochrome P450 n=1 Tax=Phanerochaete sordida TaxID=48140 RepID=A0A9P3GH17_9APHY|nr:cytochrome P450 [Phanerochaete sordida]